MAARKMTFSVPEELAELLVRRVPARDRSRFMSDALEKSLHEEEKNLIASCLAANEDRDLKAIEQEWDQLNDPVVED